ncbi:MAG: hypothetical protein ABIG60_03625 [Patescibacteria group bacterium]
MKKNNNKITVIPKLSSENEPVNESQLVTCSFCETKSQNCISLKLPNKNSQRSSVGKIKTVCRSCAKIICTVSKRQRLLQGIHPAKLSGKTPLMEMLEETPEEKKEREEKERKREEFLQNIKPSDE